VAKGGCGEGLVATGVAGVGKWCADGWTGLCFGWFHRGWILGFSIFGAFLAVPHKVRLHPVPNSSTKHFFQLAANICTLFMFPFTYQ
jgi:hypothetical protein